MFDKFGEMDSYKEINELADNLLKEGDIKSIREMSEENGIPEELTDLFITKVTPYLCDAMTAAHGKIDLECRELNPKEIMADWVEYLKCECAEQDKLAIAVRKKGKTLKGCIGEILKWSFSHQIPIDKEITKAAGVTANRVTLGIPGMGQAKKIIKQYYLGGQDNE